jgi:sigma54-dependent transcription regulator
MSDTEILSKILAELKDINNTIRDLYSGMEAQNEMLNSKLSVIENIAVKSRDSLSTIENNTTP